MVSILSFIVVIGVVIFVHELGHFLAARSVGIRVLAFSLGYPPNLLRRKVGHTEYRIGVIPLGGYVRMAGMIDEGLEGEEALTGAPWEYVSKNTIQKLWVMGAGVLMNFLLAVVLYTLIAAVEGIPEPAGPVVGGISPGSPAEEAGLLVGDRILSIDGVPIETWEDLTANVHPKPEQEVRVVLARGTDTLEVALTTMRRKMKLDGEVREVGLMGIAQMMRYRPATAGEIATAGFVGTWNVVRTVGEALWRLMSGEASLKDLGGPVMIAKLSGESAKAGPMALISFIAFISVNIGCLNLLPIPALDGGHAAILLLEAVLRREVPTRAKLIAQQVGMLLLLALIVAIFFNDLKRIFGFEWLTRIF